MEFVNEDEPGDDGSASVSYAENSWTRFEVFYDRSNETWVWDGNGDGYCDKSAANIETVATATGFTVAELTEIMNAAPIPTMDDLGAVAE